MEDCQLFGGNMAVRLPKDRKDMSEVRQIPDNQEVFVHSDTDQSLIVEILEYVQQADEYALRTHFEDLAEGNDACGQHSSINLMEAIPSSQVNIPQCTKAYYLKGDQHVAKYKESARNKVEIHLALFRIPSKQTDIVVTFNNPVHINPSSSSNKPVPQTAELWNNEHFKQIIASLRIVDIDFLGS